jgi:hypothetical protein
MAALAGSPARAELIVDGTIADAGWGGNYTRWTGETFTPNTDPVTIEGWVELSSLDSGQAIMVGLLDKQWVDGGNSGYMGGAYAYFANIGGTTFRIGPSDGNLGGEIVQTYVEVPKDPSGPNQIDFSMLINAGTIELTAGGGTRTDTYGVIKAMNSTTAYTWDEFEFGAYLGADLWGNSVDYHIVASQPGGQVPIPEPSTFLVWSLLAALGLGTAAYRRKR